MSAYSIDRVRVDLRRERAEPRAEDDRDVRRRVESRANRRRGSLRRLERASPDGAIVARRRGRRCARRRSFLDERSHPGRRRRRRRRATPQAPGVRLLGGGHVRQLALDQQTQLREVGAARTIEPRELILDATNSRRAPRRAIAPRRPAPRG